jgi:hypothetical protein
MFGDECQNGRPSLPDAERLRADGSPFASPHQNTPTAHDESGCAYCVAHQLALYEALRLRLAGENLLLKFCALSAWNRGAFAANVLKTVWKQRLESDFPRVCDPRLRNRFRNVLLSKCLDVLLVLTAWSVVCGFTFSFAVIRRARKSKTRKEDLSSISAS